MPMLAAILEPVIAQNLSKIAVPGVKEPTETLHVTVLYISEYDVDSVAQIAAVLPDILKTTSGWIPANVSYISYFNPKPGKPIPVVLPVESPLLHDLKEKICKVLDDKNVSYSKDWKAFKPHVTLSYSEDRPSVGSIEPISWYIKSLELWPMSEGSEGKLTFFIDTPNIDYAILNESISAFTKGITLSDESSDKLKAFKAKLDVQKSLAALAAVEAKRANLMKAAQEREAAEPDYTVVGTIGLKKSFSSIHETPVARAELIATPPAVSLQGGDEARSECHSCGYMFKSCSGCPRCKPVAEGVEIGHRHW